MTEENDLYPRLLLLHLLSPFLGTHIERQFKQNDSKSSSDELRRSFLECISYLCDYEKGGATVTAAALQKLDYSNFLWLAANEGVKPNVEEFVLWVLERLKDITPDTQESIKRDILRRAVKLASQRMEFYRTKMVEFSKQCRTLLKAMDSDIQAAQLRSWLKKVQYETDWQQLATMCYDARGKQMQELMDKANEADCFGVLAHFIGRLGAHQYAVLMIVRAMMKVSSLQQISKVRIEQSSEVQVVTLHRNSLDPYNLLKQICKKTSEVGSSSRLHRFVDIDYESDLQQKMEHTPPIPTRVHAELLLVDLFSRRSFDFADEDKYIGCSKPACYFCYSWISHHRKEFILPPSHNKVILGCRGPDVDPKLDINGNGAKLRARMCEQMVWQLEQDIMTRLSSDEGHNHFQHCSTDGSSRAPTIVTALNPSVLPRR